MLRLNVGASELTGFVSREKDDAPLQNLIDGIIELYLSTLYKLRFLS